LEAAILLGIVVFAGTTASFILLYRRAITERGAQLQVGGKAPDEEAFARLEEILSRSRREDLKKMLSELRVLRIKAEEMARRIEEVMEGGGRGTERAD